MSEINYKVGDRVRIKSFDWFKANEYSGQGMYDDVLAFLKMTDECCGKELTIDFIFTDERGTGYIMKEPNASQWRFTDSMIECLVERNGKTYPYKIGDRVILKGNNRRATITDLKYNSWGNLSYYIKIDNDKDITVDYPTELLLPYDNVVKDVVDTKPQAEQREVIVTHGTPMLAVTTDSIIAKINFIDNYYGNLFLDAIKQGQNIVIKPYGHAEHDNDGNIKNFNLVGFNIGNFIQEEIKEDKPQVEQVSSKHHYIGKYVHAGGELNGIVGYIVDVKHESDDIFGEELWFYIKDEEDGIIHRYCKEEIQEIVIGITYKDLE